VKLTDYHESLEDLLAADNAFAFITAAHILTRRTRKHPQERYAAKQRLVRLLYQRQWEKQQVIDLFIVVDWLLHLPPALEKQLQSEIKILEEAESMRYVTSIERFGIEKGIEQGLEQGLERGRQEGLLVGEARILSRQLERRFGVLPDWVVDRLNRAEQADLECWGDRVVSVSTLEAVFDGAAH